MEILTEHFLAIAAGNLFYRERAATVHLPIPNSSIRLGKEKSNPAGQSAASKDSGGTRISSGGFIVCKVLELHISPK